MTLDAGANGLFMSTCASPSGSATAKLADQNGDQTASVSSPFTVADCTAKASSGASNGNGSGNRGGSGSGGTGSSAGGAATRPRLSRTSISGLRTGRVAVGFTVTDGRRAAKLDTLTVALPAGMSFTRHRVGKKLKEINSTFDGLRFPSTCPATPARFSVAASPYSSSTVQTTSEPLTVVGCSSAPYAPAFSVSAARDSADKQVTLTTTVTQTANQATSRSVSLAFPPATLAPNLASVKALCPNLSSGTCTTVGSAGATSPLYPTALSGKAYLTGSASGLSLTLVFPAPFSLTLTGQVNLVNNSASFTGLPDIPLTDLGVTLDGGVNGLFLATCETPTGTATATLTRKTGIRRSACRPRSRSRTARPPPTIREAPDPAAAAAPPAPAAPALPGAVPAHPPPRAQRPARCSRRRLGSSRASPA